jgi:hypothetical protein
MASETPVPGERLREIQPQVGVAGRALTDFAIAERGTGIPAGQWMTPRFAYAGANPGSCSRLRSSDWRLPAARVDEARRVRLSAPASTAVAAQPGEADLISGRARRAEDASDGSCIERRRRRDC